MTDSADAPEFTPNKKVIEKWVTALESGEYDQGRGYLNTNTGLCCLGVLCELAVQDGVINPGVKERGFVAYEDPRDVEVNGSYNDKPYDQMPPPAVMEWVGLDPEHPKAVATVGEWIYDEVGYDGREEQVTKPVELVHLNDEEGFSFSQIAAALRETYL